MTDQEQKPFATQPPEYQTQKSGSSKILEDIFLLGYTESDNFVIYQKDDKEVVVRFRTLYPSDIQAVFEATERFESSYSKLLAEQMETLARATITINNTPLTLSKAEESTLEKLLGKKPSQLEIQRYVFTHKLKSEYVLDAMFDAYSQFVSGIKDNFDEVKKKLQSQISSS